MVEMGHGLWWQVKDKHVRDKIKQTQTKYTCANQTALYVCAVFKHEPVIFASHFGHTFHISMKKDMCYPAVLLAQCWVMNCPSTPHIYMFNTRESVTHGKNTNDVAGLWRGELLEQTLCVCRLSWRQTGWVYHREGVQPRDGCTEVYMYRLCLMCLYTVLNIWHEVILVTLDVWSHQLL